MCSASLSLIFACLLRSAASLNFRVSCQVECGLYCIGRIGMKSLIGLSKIHCAGDSFVEGSGVFLYCKTALCTASVLKSPFVAVLFVINRFIVFTPTSALQLPC